MSVPKVFISYSHDSQEHKKWVLDLATRLRNTGIDAIIDQWELQPGDDLPHFMETHLANSNYVLMVCSDRYVEKANSGTGGVGYEKMIITSDLIKSIDTKKVIPIIRQQGTKNVPTFLKTKLFLDFSHADEFEFNYDELIRAIHQSPLYKKPEIGNNPFTPVNDIQPEKNKDLVKVFMTIVINDYESGAYFTDRRRIMHELPMSRIMFEFFINDIIDKKLVVEDSGGDFVLTEEGKHYAVEHKIISI